MRTKLLTLSACAVLITGCTTFGHQPEINTEGIDSIFVYTGLPKNKVESDIYQVLLQKTQKGLKEKGYNVLQETQNQTTLMPNSWQELKASKIIMRSWALTQSFVFTTKCTMLKVS